MTDPDAEERLRLLETEIERRLAERFAALREEFDRMRLETDRRWFGFLERFDQDLKGVVPSELLSPQPALPKAPGLVGIGVLRGLDQANTQVDVLHKFLDECRRHCSRAALLVARGASIGAWKAVGFTAHGGDDEGIRHISMPLAEGGLLSRVMAGNPLRLPPSNEISSHLRALKVADAVAIPMVVREKISGALYADCLPGEEESFDPDALGLLTFLAGVLVDRLAGRRLKPAPALRVPEIFKRPDPVGMWMNEEPSAVEELPPATEIRTDAASAEPAEKDSFDAAPSVRIPEMPVPAAEGVRRLGGPLAEAGPAADERHEEARRFARLLVSEIKLYNERDVIEGREDGNLYERLRDDIDRSRQMYNDRIPEDVRSASNFFNEELVRILADGRPEVLGI